MATNLNTSNSNIGGASQGSAPQQETWERHFIRRAAFEHGSMMEKSEDSRWLGSNLLLNYTRMAGWRLFTVGEYAIRLSDEAAIILLAGDIALDVCSLHRKVDSEDPREVLRWDEYFKQEAAVEAAKMEEKGEDSRDLGQGLTLSYTRKRGWRLIFNGKSKKLEEEDAEILLAGYLALNEASRHVRDPVEPYTKFFS